MNLPSSAKRIILIIRKLAHPAIFVPITLVLSLILSLIIFKNPKQLSLRLLEIAVIWAPLLLIVSLPRLLKYWRQTLLFLVTTILSLTALSLSGNYILKKKVLPDYNLNVEHWPRLKPGVANEDGVLPGRPAKDYSPDKFNIIFLGDSFPFGFGLENHLNAFPFVAEKMLQNRYPKMGIQVANFAWTNSSPVLHARRLKKIGAKYNPDLIIHTIDMTDFGDDIHFLKELESMEKAAHKKVSIFRAMKVRFSMFFGLRDVFAWLPGQLAWGLDRHFIDEDIVNEQEIELNNLRYYYPLWQPLEKSEPHLQITWNAVIKTRRIAKALGAQYALFILPRCQHYDLENCPMDHVNFYGGILPQKGEYLYEPFKYFKEKAGQVDFPIHSLVEDFQNTSIRPLNIKNNDHYNKDGHGVAAKGIVRHLSKRSFVDWRLR